MLESGISAGMMVSSARAANSAGTSSPSIRREVGCSSRDGQPRHVEIVHAGGVAAGDLGLFVVRTPARISAKILRDWGNVDSLCG
jgi:hypothetical protein